MVRTLHLIFVGLGLAILLAGPARGETFRLSDGRTLSGAIVSYNESGLIVRESDNKYSDRIPWTQFSQDDLKRLAQDAKIAPMVEPFIEVTDQDRIQRTEVQIKTPPRLGRPEVHTLLGAMFSSSVGLIVLLALYAANIYGAYEVAIFRARPVALVCGLAAVPFLGVLSSIVFLAMPTYIRRAEEEELPAQAPAAPPSYSVGGQAAPVAAAAAPAAGGLRLNQGSGSRSTSSLPTTQVFQRGAFTFNRRFFETRFPGFFSMIRRDAEKDMVLVVKSARGQYVAQRITRIAANDLHLHVQKGPASEEVMIPFSDIQEVQLKHKDA